MNQNEIKELAREIVKEQMRYEIVGVKEAAEILGVSTSTVYSRISEIPHSKFGKRLRFSKGDLLKLIWR